MEIPSIIGKDDIQKTVDLSSMPADVPSHSTKETLPPTPTKSGLVDDLSNEEVLLIKSSAGILVGVTEYSKELVFTAGLNTDGQVKVEQHRNIKPASRDDIENLENMVRENQDYNRTSPQPAQHGHSEQPTGSQSLDVVEAIANKLQWGSIAFDTPHKLALGESATIELLLSPTKSTQELQSKMKVAENTSKARIRISNRMEAMLKGQGFKIEALVPQEQAISKGKTTHWKWEATPTEDGDKILHLSISAIIKISSEDAPLVIQTYSKKIRVEISAAQRVLKFFSGNWQWLWASILVPLLPFLWRISKLIAIKSKSDPTSDP